MSDSTEPLRAVAPRLCRIESARSRQFDWRRKVQPHCASERPNCNKMPGATACLFAPCMTASTKRSMYTSRIPVLQVLCRVRTNTTVIEYELLPTHIQWAVRLRM